MYQPLAVFDWKPQQTLPFLAGVEEAKCDQLWLETFYASVISCIPRDFLNTAICWKRQIRNPDSSGLTWVKLVVRPCKNTKRPGKPMKGLNRSILKGMLSVYT